MTFKKLVHLDLSQNQLSSIQDLTFNLPNLKSLNLADNILNNFDNEIFFQNSNLENLKTLDLANNLLRSFNLDVLPTQIEQISLDHNKILTLNNLSSKIYPNLESLVLNKNSLKNDFSFLKKLPNLKILKIEENQLEALDLNLQKSEVNSGEDGSDTPSPIKIYASKNEIQWLSKANLGPGANRIHTLDLSYNRLKGIQVDTLNNLPETANIYLTNNKFNCCYSSHIYDWILKRNNQSPTDDGDFDDMNVNGDLTCYSSILDETVIMSKETTQNQNCFNRKNSLKFENPPGIVTFRLTNENHMADYAFWKVSIFEADTFEEFLSFKLNKFHDYKSDVVQHEKNYQICYKFSEKNLPECETVKLLSQRQEHEKIPILPDIDTTDKPSFEIEDQTGADSEGFNLSSYPGEVYIIIGASTSLIFICLLGLIFKCCWSRNSNQSDLYDDNTFHKNTNHTNNTLDNSKTGSNDYLVHTQNQHHRYTPPVTTHHPGSIINHVSENQWNKNPLLINNPNDMNTMPNPRHHNGQIHHHVSNTMAGQKSRATHKDARNEFNFVKIIGNGDPRYATSSNQPLLTSGHNSSGFSSNNLPSNSPNPSQGYDPTLPIRPIPTIRTAHHPGVIATSQTPPTQLNKLDEVSSKNEITLIGGPSVGILSSSGYKSSRHSSNSTHNLSGNSDGIEVLKNLPHSASHNPHQHQFKPIVVESSTNHSNSPNITEEIDNDLTYI